MIRTAILSVRAAPLGTEEDSELPVAAVREVLAEGPFTEVDYDAVPDEQAIIRARLRRWADTGSADLVLTLGGVGPALRHRTPDATLEVVERQFPGIPEQMRAAGARVEPYAGLWRVAVGSRRSTLIANLPGTAQAARAALAAVTHLLASGADVLAAHDLEIGSVGPIETSPGS